MGYVVMKVVASFTAEHVAAFRDAHIAHGAHIHTDGLRGFPAFADPATQRTHQVTVTASKRPDRARGSAFFWINTAIANLSTSAPRSRPPTKRPRRSTCPIISAPSVGPRTTAKHARHDQRRLPRHRYINRADQKDRLCTACRGDWLIGGIWEDTAFDQ